MRWDSFIYFFVVGGLISVIGFIVPWMSGDWSWVRRSDRLTALSLWCAFFIYFIGYLLWQFHAIGII